MEKNNLTAYTCPGCGARLDPAEAEKARGTIICRYCKAKVRLDRHEKSTTSGLPFTGKNRRPGKYLMASIILALGLVVLISVAIFVMSKRVFQKAIKVPGQVKLTDDTIRITAETQSSFPISCRGEKSIALINQTFTRDGTILDSGGPCRVFINNTTLVSKERLLKISGNGSVTIENSNLTGGSCAVWASDRVSVAISNSNINSSTTAVHAVGNATVTITDCNLTGPMAAQAGDNAKIVLINTNVKGETKGGIEVR